MATFRPLVLLAGLLQELQSTDALSVAAAGALTLGTGWSNFGSSYATPYFIRSYDGTVRLRGLITGSGSATSAVLTLPVGSRPTIKQPFLVYGAGANYAVLIVDTDGTVTLSSPAAASLAYLNLGQVTFNAQF